jgi:hypothetical protein
MPRTLIEVTADDIAKGTPGRSDSCAFALALRRVYPKASFWNSGWSDGELSGQTTRRIEEFGDRFDEGQPVKPGRFALPPLTR